MKMSTINQLVEGVLENGMMSPRGARHIANEIAIFGKMFLIMEDTGDVEGALEYFFEPHGSNEYLEWRTGVFNNKEEK